MNFKFNFLIKKRMSILNLCYIKKEWHKGCFKCKTCNTQLNLNTYKDCEKEIYCKGCFGDKLHPYERNRKELETAHTQQ